MKRKLLTLLEKYSIKANDEKSYDALVELSNAYLQLNNLTQAIHLTEQALKHVVDPEWRRNSDYSKIVKKTIELGDRIIFESIASNIEEEYRVIYEGLLDLKHKKYESSFNKLAQLDEEDYEFNHEITDMIKEILPHSLKLFPIEIINKKLSPKFLKEQVISDFLSMIMEQANPSSKKEVIKLFKKHAQKDERKSYINDYMALINAKEGKLKQALKYASKACDLRELSLLKQIATIFAGRNKESNAIDVAIIDVDKSKLIDWNQYSCSMGPLFTKFSSGESVTESLINLARLFHSNKNRDKLKPVVNEIISTIETLPEEDFYGEWKLNQYFLLMDLAVEISDLELLESTINTCTPLEIKNQEALDTNTDTTMLQSIIKHKKCLSNQTINSILKLIKAPLNDKSNSIYTQVKWFELFFHLNKIEQAKKLGYYLLKKIKNRDDYFNMNYIAPIHFKINNTNEIEDILKEIGLYKATMYLNSVSKKI